MPSFPEAMLKIIINILNCEMHKENEGLLIVCFDTIYNIFKI
jgi:hypothetical protein